MNPTFPRKVRTIWLSDVHLGIRQSRADKLLEFLDHHDPEYLYLVGDIVDGLRLRRRWYWDERSMQVFHRILELSRQGTRVVYLPGNHDAFLRTFIGLNIEGIRLEAEAVHTLADGRRMLVIHGDAYERQNPCHPAAYAVGEALYEGLYRLDHVINRLVRPLTGNTLPLCSWVKDKAKKATNFIQHYEDFMTETAQARGVDGVICGHIHHAQNSGRNPVAYFNSGDWVENCTALVEHPDGEIDVVHWLEESETGRMPAAGARPLRPASGAFGEPALG